MGRWQEGREERKKEERGSEGERKEEERVREGGREVFLNEVVTVTYRFVEPFC